MGAVDTNQIFESLGSEKLSLEMALRPHTERFPTLNSLRAFEAAARLGGFTQAAQEMSVTPGAVAAQVKILEAEYGCALFERHPKGIKLTALGESVKDDFVQAFDGLGEAVRKLRRQANPLSVHIATSPALAQLWFAPRLLKLREKFRSVDLSITALEEPPHLKRSPYDMCVFYTVTTQPKSIRVADEFVTPVCTPSLAEQLSRPSDLARVTCIGDVVWEDWKVWKQGMGLQGLEVGAGPRFSLYGVAVQEALLGLGVIIGRRSLVQAYLDSGALVAPFPAIPLGLSISLWKLTDRNVSREVSAVADAIRTLA